LHESRKVVAQVRGHAADNFLPRRTTAWDFLICEEGWFYKTGEVFAGASASRSENFKLRCTTGLVVVVVGVPGLAEDFLRFVRRAHLLSLIQPRRRATTFRVS